MNILPLLFALFYQVTAFGRLIDQQQCYEIRTIQFQLLLKDFVAQVPPEYLNDKRALVAYIDERFVDNEYMEWNTSLKSAPFNASKTPESELHYLVSRYLIAPSADILERIAVWLIVFPDYPAPQAIKDSLRSMDLSSKSVLVTFIDVYLETNSLSLLPYIVKSASRYKDVLVPNSILSVLVEEGFLPRASESDFRHLIQEALNNPARSTLELIVDLSILFPEVGLPPSLVRAMIELGIFTYQQGEFYYLRLLEQAQLTMDLLILPDIYEFSKIFPYISIPEYVVRDLVEHGFISEQISRYASEESLILLLQQATVSPTTSILQEIAQLTLLFPDVPMPAIVMRELLTNSLIDVAKGETFLIILIEKAKISFNLEILQEIAYLYDLFPSVHISDEILSALVTNGFLSTTFNFSNTSVSATRYNELIDAPKTLQSIPLLRELSFLEPLFPDTPMPKKTSDQVRLVTLIESYISFPTLSSLHELSYLLEIYPDFPVPESFRNEIFSLSTDKPSFGSVSELKLHSLIVQYLTNSGVSSFDEMSSLLQFYPDFPVPVALGVNLTRGIAATHRYSVEISLTNKLVDLYSATSLEIILYFLAELQYRSPELPIPSPIKKDISKLPLNDLPEENYILFLQLINEFYVTHSDILLERISLITQKTNIYGPDYIQYRYFILEYMKTRSLQPLQQIGYSFLKFPECALPEIIVEALITQNVIATETVNTQLLLKFFVRHYSTTESYIILKFMANLYWLHTEISLPLETIELLVRFGIFPTFSDSSGNFTLLQSSLTLLPSIISNYKKTHSIETLELIIQNIEVIPSYPLANSIWLDYFVLMFNRTSSLYYLKQIGLRLYISFDYVLPESIFALLMQENLLMATPQSEKEVLLYIIENYPFTQSPYIISATYELYVKYPSVKLPENILDIFIMFNMISSNDTENRVVKLRNLVKELESLVRDQPPLTPLNVIAALQITILEKFMLQNKGNLEGMREIMRKLEENSQIMMTSQRTLLTMLNGIVASFADFMAEAQLKFISCREKLSHPQASIILEFDIRKDFEMAFIYVGRANGLFDVFSSELGKVTEALNSEALRSLINFLFYEESEVVQNIGVEYFFPEIGKDQVVIFDTILPLRLENVEKLIDSSELRLMEVTEQYLAFSSQNEKRISQLFYSILELIRSFISQAKLNAELSRKILLNFFASYLTISPAELEKFSASLINAEINVGKAEGALSSLLAAINSTEITVASLSFVLRELFRLDKSESLFETFSESLLTSNTLIDTQSTIILTLTWRTAAVEKNLFLVQNRVNDFKAFLESIATASKEDLSPSLKSALASTVSLTNEAEARIISIKNLLDFVSNNRQTVIINDQLTVFDDFLRIVQVNFGKVSGIIEAVITSYQNGDFVFDKVHEFLQALTGLEFFLPDQTIFEDLNVLALANSKSLAQYSRSIIQNLAKSYGYNIMPRTDVVHVIPPNEDNIMNQMVLVSVLPTRQAFLESNLLTIREKIGQLKIFISSMTEDVLLKSYPIYFRLTNSLASLFSYIDNLIFSAQETIQKNRNIIQLALGESFFINVTDLAIFVQNVKLAMANLGQIEGVVKAFIDFYASDYYTVENLVIMLEYISKHDKVDEFFRLLVELESLNVNRANENFPLLTFLSWRHTTTEKNIVFYQKRLEEIKIFIFNMTENNSNEIFNRIYTLLSSFMAEAVAKFSVNNELLAVFNTSSQKLSVNEISIFSDNEKAISENLGKIEGAITALLEGYQDDYFSTGDLENVLTILTTFEKESFFQKFYDEAEVLSSLSITTDFEKTLNAIIQRVKESQKIEDSNEMTLLLEGILNMVHPFAVPEGDNLSYQIILAIVMPSLHNKLEMYLELTRNQLTDLSSLTSAISESLLYPSISTFSESLQNLIIETTKIVDKNRQTIVLASERKFSLSKNEVGEFYKNAEKSFLNLGKISGAVEAFVNSYNTGLFNIESTDILFESLQAFESISGDIASFETYSDFQSKYSGKGTVAPVLFWQHNYLESLLKVSSNRLTQLNIYLSEFLSNAGFSYKILEAMRNLCDSLIKEAFSRQYINEKLVETNDSQYFDTMESLIPFRENQVFIISTLGRVEAMIAAITESSGNFEENDLFYLTIERFQTESVNEAKIFDLFAASSSPSVADFFSSIVTEYLRESEKTEETFTESAALRALIAKDFYKSQNSQEAAISSTLLAFILPRRMRITESDYFAAKYETENFYKIIDSFIESNSSPVRSLLKVVRSDVENFLNQARIRLEENRRLLNNLIQSNFTITNNDLRLFVENANIVASAIGSVMGKIEVVTGAINFGELSLENLTEILTTFSDVDYLSTTVQSTINDISGASLGENTQFSSEGSSITLSILSVRLALVEKHLAVTRDRISELLPMIETISNETPGLEKVLQSLSSFIQTQSFQAQSKFIVVKNFYDDMINRKSVENKEQLTIMFENLRLVTQNLGVAEGAMKAVFLEYANKNLSIATLKPIIDFLTESITSFESFFEEMKVYNSLTVGTTLKSYVPNVLQSISSLDESKGLYDELNSIQIAIRSLSQELSSVTISTVEDAVAFQSVIAIVFPSRLAFLRQLLVNLNTHIEETRLKIDNVLRELPSSGLSSSSKLTPVQGVFSIIQYFSNEAGALATSNEEILTLIAEKKYFVTKKEIQSLLDNFLVAFNAVGKASGALDSLDAVLVTGEANAAAIRKIVEIVFQSDSPILKFEANLGDWLSASGPEGFDQSGILEIILTSIQTNLERALIATKKRIIEVSNIILSLVPEMFEISDQPYHKLKTMLEAIISLSENLVSEASFYVGINTETINQISSIGFPINSINLKSYYQNTLNAYKMIARAEGAIAALSEAYDDEKITANVAQDILRSILLTQSSTTSLKELLKVKQNVPSNHDVDAQVIVLESTLPSRQNSIDKMVSVNQERIISFKAFIKNLIESSQLEGSVAKFLQSLMVAVSAHISEIIAINFSNKNLLSQIAKQNFYVTDESLTAFFGNEEKIWRLFGILEGITEPVINLIQSDSLSTQNLQPFVELLVNEASSFSLFYDSGIALVNENPMENYKIIFEGTNLSLKSVVPAHVAIAVVITMRQALIDKELVSIQIQLDNFKKLYAYSSPKENLGGRESHLNNLTSTVISTLLINLQYLIDEAETRAIENRAMVARIMDADFEANLDELKIFDYNLQVIYNLLGQSNGALKALTLFDNTEYLDIDQTYSILIEVIPGVLSINSIYEELKSPAYLEITETDNIAGIYNKILPWRLVTLEKHVLNNKEKITSLETLINDIILDSGESRLKYLLTSISNFAKALESEAESKLIVFKNVVNAIISGKTASESEITALWDSIRVISTTLGKAEGALTAVLTVYQPDSFSSADLQRILTEITSSLSDLENFYPEVQNLADLVSFPKVQFILESIVSSLSTRNEEASFLDVRGSLKHLTESGLFDSFIVNSVDDAIGLQTVCAVLLPARHVNLEASLVVHEKHLEEAKHIVNSVLVSLEKDLSPSSKTVIKLMHGTLALASYFFNEAENLISSNRKTLTYAISRNFLLTRDEYESFVDKTLFAFSALGRCTATVDILLEQINSGSFEVAKMGKIIEVLMQIDSSTDWVHEFYEDLQSSPAPADYLERSYVLEIILPFQQKALDSKIAFIEEKIFEFEILVNSIVFALQGDFSASSIISQLNAIVYLVSTKIKEASSLSLQTSSMLLELAENSFDISGNNVINFSQTIQKGFSLIGEAEAAIAAVIAAYNEGKLKNSAQEILVSVSELEKTLSEASNIEEKLEIPSEFRPTILAVVLSSRLRSTKENLMLNQNKLKELSEIIEGFSLNSQNSSVKEIVESIYHLVVALLQEALGILSINTNHFLSFEKNNFQIESELLEEFFENEIKISILSGKIAGAMEAFILSYLSGELSVQSATLIVQEISQLEQVSFSIEENLSSASVSVDSTLQETLDTIVQAFPTFINENAEELKLPSLSIPVLSSSSVAETINLALLIPKRQVYTEKMVVNIQHQIREFLSLSESILNDYNRPEYAYFFQHVNSLLSAFFKESLARVEENRKILIKVTEASFSGSQVQIALFTENSRVAFNYLGRIAALMEKIIFSYSAGDFNELSISDIIVHLQPLENDVLGIDAIYRELLPYQSSRPNVTSYLLSLILGARLETLEQHVSINQQRIKEISVMVENILPLTSTITIVAGKQIRYLLTLLSSLTEEAEGRLLVNRRLLAIFETYNFVIAHDEELNLFVSNVDIVGNLLGQAGGIADAMIASLISGDSTLKEISVLLEAIETVEETESMFMPFIKPSSALSERLDFLIASMPSQYNTTNAIKSIAPELASSDEFSYQIIIAIFMTSRQTALERLLVSLAERIENSQNLIESIVLEYEKTNLPETKQLVAPILRISNFVNYLFNEGQARASSSKNYVTSALGLKFLVPEKLVKDFVDSLSEANLLLGKVAAVLDLLQNTFSPSEFSSNALSEILLALKNFVILVEGNNKMNTIMDVYEEYESLVIAYLESKSFIILKQISQIFVYFSDILTLPPFISEDMSRFGLVPGQKITEEQILQNLIFEYLETQSKNILERLIPLLQKYPSTNIPSSIVRVLIESSVIIQTEQYYKSVIEQHEDYPEEVIKIVSQLISVYPHVALPLPLLEKLVKQDFVTKEVFNQLIDVYLQTQSQLSFQLIFELYPRFPLFPLPISVLDAIYERNIPSSDLPPTTRDSAVPEIARSLSSPESLLSYFIEQYQKSPTEEILLEIDELYHIYPLSSIAPDILTQINYVRLLQEIILMPFPSLENLQTIARLADLYPIVTMPEELKDQIVFIRMLDNLSPNLETLLKIWKFSERYHYIPLPLRILEQLSLVKFFHQPILTVAALERIVILSTEYQHIALPPPIIEQISLLALLKFSFPSVSDLEKIKALSDKYPHIPLPPNIRDQLRVRQLLTDHSITTIPAIEEVIQLSLTYPNIPIPSYMKDLEYFYNAINHIIITKFASKIEIDKILRIASLHPDLILPSTVTDISRLYELLDSFITNSSSEVVREIFELARIYPKISIPEHVIERYVDKNTPLKTSTESNLFSTESSFNSFEGSESASAPLSAREQISELVSRSLRSPDYTLILEIMNLLPLAEDIDLPLVTQSEITLIELIKTVSSSFLAAKEQLLKISELSLSFPHIPIPDWVLLQIKMMQIMTEIENSPSPSIILLRELYEISPSVRMTVPVKIQGMLSYLELFDEANSLEHPTPDIIEKVAQLSPSYPFIPLTARLKDLIVLHSLIVQASTLPSKELLLKIWGISKEYPFFPIPGPIQEQITVLVLLQELDNPLTFSIPALKRVSTIAPRYPHISPSSQVLDQISFVNMMEETVSSSAVTFAVINQIMDYSQKYPYITMPVSIKELYELFLLIQATQQSLNSNLSPVDVKRLSDLLRNYPHIVISEEISQIIALEQLLIQMERPSMVTIEEIARLQIHLPHVQLSDDLRQQIYLLTLIKNVSYEASPSVSDLITIHTLSVMYPYILVPDHVQQQIILILFLDKAATDLSSIYKQLPQIIDLSSRFSHIPISEEIQNLIVFYELMERALLVPYPPTSLLFQINEMYKLYPDFPVHSSLTAVMNQMNQLSTTTPSDLDRRKTLPNDFDESTTASTTYGFEVPSYNSSQIILRQLILEAVEGKSSLALLQQMAVLLEENQDTVMPTALQEQLFFLRLVNEALASPAPTPYLLQQISYLSKKYPMITLPVSLQEPINLVFQLKEIETESYPSMNKIELITTLHLRYPFVPIPGHIKPQILLLQLIQEAFQPPIPTETVLRQISQLARIYTNILIPKFIQDLIILMEFSIDETTITPSEIEKMDALSREYPDVELPSSIFNVIELVRLFRLEIFTLEIIQRIEAFSLTYVNVLVPEKIQERVYLCQLIRKMNTSFPGSMYDIKVFNEISLLLEKYSDVIVSQEIIDKISFVTKMERATTTESCNSSVIAEISSYASRYPEIPITPFVEYCTQILNLTSNLVPSQEVLLQIYGILEQYPTIAIPEEIYEQIIFIQLIKEFSLVSSPSLTIIYEIRSYALKYRNVELPFTLQEVLLLIDLIQEVVTYSSVTVEIIAQINTLSLKYPYIPMPLVVSEQSRLKDLVDRASSLPVPSPELLTEINVISRSFPDYPLPEVIIEQEKLLEQRNDLQQLIANIESTGIVDDAIVRRIEELSPIFPDISVPTSVNDYVFSHMQELILQQLITDALETPESFDLLQQIEHISMTLPNYTLPEDIIKQIDEMHQLLILRELIEEVESAPVIDLVTLDHISQVLRNFPNFPVTPLVESAILLQSLTENIAHSSSSSPVNLTVLLLIRDSYSNAPNFPLSETVISGIELADLIQKVEQEEIMSDEHFQNIEELAKKFPHFEMPAFIQNKIISSKLRLLSQKALSAKSVDTVLLQKINDLWIKVPDIQLPKPIEEQLEFYRIIQESQTAKLSASAIARLIALAKLYPSMPIPASLRQLMASSTLPERKISAPRNATGNEAQLRKYIAMYDRMPSPMILREIARLWPTFPNVDLPEKIKLALVTQGMLPSDEFPEIKLQQLIQQYQLSPSQTLIEEITGLVLKIPNVHLTPSIQAAVAQEQVRTVFVNVSSILSQNELDEADDYDCDDFMRAIRLESVGRQIELAKTSFGQASDNLKQLLDNLRSIGHPIQQVDLKIFQGVIDSGQKYLNDAERKYSEALPSSNSEILSEVISLLGQSKGTEVAMLEEFNKFIQKLMMENQEMMKKVHELGMMLQQHHENVQ